MAEMDDVPGWIARLFRLAQATFGWHRALFIGLNVVITAVNVWMGPPWWGVWPLLVTGLLFMLHFLVYSTSLVDDTWVEERAAEIYDRSYDQGHLDAIAEHYKLETPVAAKRRALKERREGRVSSERVRGEGAGKTRS